MYSSGSSVLPPLGLTKVKVHITNDAIYAATSVNAIKAVLPPLGLTKVKVHIANDDAVYAATCVNAIKVPNFDNQDYSM